MSSAAEKFELEKNLSLVLGKPVNLHNPEVLKLTPDELKKIYHKRAKELHPDNAARTGKDPVYLTTKFKSLSESYSYVLDFWKERNFSSVIRNSAAAQAPVYTRNRTHNHESPAGKSQNTKQQKVHTRQQDPKENAFEKRFYNGPMPCFQLRFAQFMYYSKKADWHTFIKSLSWQWKVRPRLGELAVKQGLLQNEDVLIILKNKMPDELFGKAALRLGFLQQKDLSILLGRQHLMNKPIGQFFVEQGCIAHHEIDHYISQMRKYNLHIRTRKKN